MSELLIIFVACTVIFSPISMKAAEPPTTSELAESIGMTEEEFILISSVVEAESDRSAPQDGEDTTEGRVMIALTILNRVDDDRFPETVTGVLTQRGQFSTVRNGRSVTNRTEWSDQAVLEAYEWNELGSDPETLFFNCRGYNYGEPYGYIDGNYFMTMEADNDN